MHSIMLKCILLFCVVFFMYRNFIVMAIYIYIDNFIESTTYGFLFTSCKTLQNERVSEAIECVFQSFATSECKFVQSTFYAVICLLHI